MSVGGTRERATRPLRVGYDVRFLANTLTGVGRSAIELLKELSKREEIEELVLVTDRAIPTDWMQGRRHATVNDVHYHAFCHQLQVACLLCSMRLMCCSTIRRFP